MYKNRKSEPQITWKLFKNYLNTMENQDNNNENLEIKYLENMWNKQFFRVKNSPLELEKDFMELTDRELKDRKEKIKREIEELLHKPVIVSKDDIYKFEEREMKKIIAIMQNKRNQK